MARIASVLLFGLVASMVLTTSSSTVGLYRGGQKRAALVLDRLLVALQAALRDSVPRRPAPRPAPPVPVPAARVGPHPYALDLVSSRELVRHAPTHRQRSRVLRCYFNAITCFKH